MSTEKNRRKPEKTTETGFTQRISKEYYNLTAAEKKAADYVIAHRAEAISSGYCKVRNSFCEWA